VEKGSESKYTVGGIRMNMNLKHAVAIDKETEVLWEKSCPSAACP
jgi:hypothetical protein